MKNKYYLVFCVLVFMLAACSENSQTEAGPVPEGKEVTVVLTITQTFTPVPSDTPLSTNTITATPSITPTASITPTKTATPENFILADKGFDFANVSVSNQRLDYAFIHFSYRIDLDKKLPSETAMIGVLLPAACQGVGNLGPRQVYDEQGVITVGVVEIQETSGVGRVDVLQTLSGKCEVSSFEMVIMFTQQVSVNNYKFRVVYRERIDQPLKVVRTELVPEFSKMASVKNFAFQATGPWSGKLSFDYEIAPEYFARVKNAQFHLGGTGDTLYCTLQVDGPRTSTEKGNYVINIDMNQYRRDDSWAVSCHNKLDEISRIVFDQITLSLLDSNEHFIDFSVVLKKQP